MNALRWIRANARTLICDVLSFVGAGLAIYGVWKAYPPLGFVFAGALMIAVSWQLSKE